VSPHFLAATISRTPPLIRALALLGSFGLGLAAVEPFLPSPHAPRINIRWDNDLGVADRQRLESTFGLVRPEPREGATWRYDLVDVTHENVAALVAHPAVSDTHEIDRTLGVVAPGAPRGTTWILPAALNFWREPPVSTALATASAAAFLFAALSLVLSGRRSSGRVCLVTSAGLVVTGCIWYAIFDSPAPTIVALVAAVGTAVTGGVGRTYRATPTAMALAVLVWLGFLALIGQTSVLPVAVAGGVVYLFGYVMGSFLVPPRDADRGLATAVVRTVAGLLLSVLAFFLCLRFSIPWAVGPTALLLTAVLLYRRSAFLLPRFDVTPRWDPVFAGVAAVIVFSPVLVTAIQMSRGAYPPVFFNVDTPFFLGHVHSLVKATTFPPPSLNVLGGQLPNHYGIQGAAALISRSSGLAPHHALFLVVVPLLVAGTVAAAVELIKGIGPRLPWLISLPLLLNPVPTFWAEFTSIVGSSVMKAMKGLTLAPLETLLGEHQLWGVANVAAPNVATPFLVLAVLAGIFNSPARGWRLPVFLAGIAIAVKAPTAVSLLAGLGLAVAARAAVEHSLRPLLPAVAAGAVFAAVYGLLWFMPDRTAETGLQLFPLYHLQWLRSRGDLAGFGTDVVWLLAPALIALKARPAARGPERPSLLIFALGPFIVANTLNVSSANGTTANWPQIMISVPLVLRAFVLSIAAPRWSGFGSRLRTAFVGLVALTTIPALIAAASYTASIVRNPAKGHEFANNRSIAEVLAVVPVAQSVIVTNDLRHPAAGSGAFDRQMQIPALFGHQAFAVDYTYEKHRFSDERLALQELLRSEQWTDAIDRAARMHHWTHFLVHKSFAHPATIPLERLFENDAYAVYRFSGTSGAR